MIKYIKRKSDNKFLQSLENDTWVDNTKDAYEMTYKEFMNTKTTLLNTYTTEEITEVVNVFKNKPMSREEKKELLNLLRK
jgi:two-component SAPR family response regulator